MNLADAIPALDVTRAGERWLASVAPATPATAVSFFRRASSGRLVALPARREGQGKWSAPAADGPVHVVANTGGQRLSWVSDAVAIAGTVLSPSSIGVPLASGPLAGGPAALPALATTPVDAAQTVLGSPLAGGASQRVRPAATPLPAATPSATSTVARSTGAPRPTPQQGTSRLDQRMQHLGRVSVQLTADPTVIGATPDGIRITFWLGGGRVFGPHVNGVVEHRGADWMHIRTDGIGIPDIHAIVRTHDGAQLLAEYSGKVDFGPDGYERAKRGEFPPTAPLALAPNFLTASDDWAFMNRLQCIGLGEVNMRTRHLEYDLYALRPEGTPHA